MFWRKRPQETTHRPDFYARILGDAVSGYYGDIYNSKGQHVSSTIYMSGGFATIDEVKTWADHEIDKLRRAEATKVNITYTS